jgi:hypothetical protein
MLEMPSRFNGPLLSAACHNAAVLPLRTVRVTRYVTPLREGGSLPAIVEADDDGLYVLKFRGAGHGAQALLAELLSGEIARALGLPVPNWIRTLPARNQTPRSTR